MLPQAAPTRTGEIIDVESKIFDSTSIHLLIPAIEGYNPGFSQNTSWNSKKIRGNVSQKVADVTSNDPKRPPQAAK